MLPNNTQCWTVVKVKQWPIHWKPIYLFKAIHNVFAWVFVGLIFVPFSQDAPALHLELLFEQDVQNTPFNTNIVIWECFVFDRAPP